MLFEFDPSNQNFCVTLNGEKPIEIERIAAALSYLSVKDVLPPPIDIEGPRTIVGRLDKNRGLMDAEFMIKGLLSNLSDWDRSATNDSLEFRTVQG